MLAYVGYNERDKHMTKQRLNKAVSREDVNELILMSLKEHAVEIKSLKSTNTRLERKVDQVISLLIEKR